MIDLFKVRMSKDVDNFVLPVLHSGYIGQGPMVEKFEDELMKELGSSIRPITVNSCTSAIDLALELCGVRSGDEIISSPQTCFASQVGAIHREAIIRWADIDRETGLMSPESAKRLITDKTRAIIAVNWAGKFCDFAALKALGIPVIEDAAHTWDSFLSHKPERGDYICYSFQAIKFLTTSDGGLLITPREKQEEARLLRWYGLDRTKNESFRCAQNIERAGFKYHMNDVCAAIGLANIPEAREAVLANRENARKLCGALRDLEYAYLAPFDDQSSYWLFPMVLNEGVSRDKFSGFLNDNGVASSPVHFRNDLYDSTKRFREGLLPGVEFFSQQQINIPCGWWLSKNDLDQVITVVNNFHR